MTMPDDPAVDAAQRAWTVHYDRDSFQTSAEGNGFASRMTDAAREALAPVQELHRPFVVSTPDGETWTECESCAAQHWPCPTARLVYRKDELT